MSREAMKQPEALRLADALDELDRQFSRNGLCGDAAAELRRLALKQWVGLTDKEVFDAIDDVLEGGGWLDVARALEAAIKRKNT